MPPSSTGTSSSSHREPLDAPRLAVASGRSYTDEFTVRNPAGTSLYHLQLHGQTGSQIYGGLVGVLLIRDAEDDASGLQLEPHRPLFVLQRRCFDSKHQRMYANGMMDRMNGLLGTRCWSTVDRTCNSVSRVGRIACAS